MKYVASLAVFVFIGVSVAANHDHHGHAQDQMPLDYVKFPYEQPLYRTSTGEVTADAIFSGITTFAKLPWLQCLTHQQDVPVDIAFLGAPFDTGTSYRPGARFGPYGIRAGSRRLNLYGGYNVPLGTDPFKSGLRIVDCGDIPVSPYDSAYAVKQIQAGHQSILQRAAFSPLPNDSHTGEALESYALDGKNHPRIITLGGDHTITLPLLRSINSVYGPISVIHFDSHLDTWKPKVFGGAPSDTASVNHGTYFWHASQEGLIKNGSSIAKTLILVCPFEQHGAIRTTLSSLEDYEVDDEVGFQRIEAREIDTLGVDGIIQKIHETVGSRPVYLSIDIDSIDPAFAPATGTPETGGWTTRELRAILRGLDGLQIVSADIVEVAPAYDTNAELTTMAAADVLFEVLTVMTKNPLGKVKTGKN
ncbi:arginase family-domain-containing protein [Rhodocollybia butyracea]|uniref:agmatinase n=1 Tax=Rhodocollybia butyracea TaxID=206335 RepID=A0A9P5QCL0_9AGAR|nr:arginase family-domain-containing protein [Rhodocollybia butyracea]